MPSGTGQKRRSSAAPPGDPAEIRGRLQRAMAAMRGDPRAALRLAEEALAAAEAGGAELQAEARLVRAHARRFAGEHEAALEDYERARQLFRRLGRPLDAARTAAGTLDSLRSLGRTEEALRVAARARRVFRRHNEPARAAVVEMNLGGLYFQRDDYARALRLWDRARPVLQGAGRSEDVAGLDNNAANALTQLDRLREAEALYASARAFYAARGMRAMEAGVDVNLGYLAYRQGRYGAALDTLRRAAEAFDALGNRPGAIITRLDLAEVYLVLNLLDEAAALAAEQLRLAREAAVPHEAARAAFYLATARGRAGRVDEALGGLVDAEGSFAARENLVWRTRCALGRAALLLARGSPPDLHEALALAQDAASVFERLDLPSRQAGALLVQARAGLARGDFRAAERAARTALATAERVGAPWLLFECQYAVGRALRARGRGGEAYAAYRLAAEALEHVRAELQPEELRVSLVSDKLDVYQELVLLCLDRTAAGGAAAEEALQYAERAKSRALAERLAGAIEVRPDPAVLGPADAAILERMARLRAELNWLYARLGDEAPSAPAGSRQHGSPLPAVARDPGHVRREVDARETELVRLHRRLQPASRAQAALLGLAEPPADTRSALAALRRHLPAGTVLVEYFQAGDELVAFVLGAAERPVARRVGPAADAEALVERFEFQVRKFGLGAAYVRAHAAALEAGANAVLAQLYEALVAPVADELPGAGSLVVVPHGLLHYVPFHAFIGPDGRPVGERFEVSYAPSAGVLAACLERGALADGPGLPLVMGVPDEGAPYVAAEVAALRRLFGPRLVFCGEEATAAVFRRHAPDADVIHLASHAVFREDNPLFSGLRLADGWLSLYDLYNLRLRARLVALSACETGLSAVLAGDELVGLSRGFFQAGTPSLLVSLWPVHDESTAHLMERFYARLRAGDRPAAALRAAQAEVRRARPHPYYWAPFLVVGRP